MTSSSTHAASATAQVEQDIAESMAPVALVWAEGEARLTAETLYDIHYFLFGDLYPWAGKVRTVPLRKGRAPLLTLRACKATGLDRLLRDFTAAAESVSGQYQFGRNLAELWGRLNRLHPFREGNGRATQVFLQAVSHRYGYGIDWSGIGRGDEFKAAEESMRENFSPYRDILWRALQPLNLDRPAGDQFSRWD